jgi:hypothetical protein
MAPFHLILPPKAMTFKYCPFKVMSWTFERFFLQPLVLGVNWVSFPSCVGLLQQISWNIQSFKELVNLKPGTKWKLKEYILEKGRGDPNSPGGCQLAIKTTIYTFVSVSVQYYSICYGIKWSEQNFNHKKCGNIMLFTVHVSTFWGIWWNQVHVFGHDQIICSLFNLIVRIT